MQTSPKTPKKIFATRLLAVTLCLVISLSAVITPARGINIPEFDAIAIQLAAQGIASNIGDVATENWTSFSGLYFEKWTTVGDPTTAIGKMTFTTPINFSDSGTQAFLQDLQNKMEMGEGSIALDVSTAAGFQNQPATLVMYGLPVPTTFDQLVVSDNDGNILDITQYVDEATFSQDPVTGDVTFDVAHFTKFEISPKPLYIYLPLIRR